MKYLIFIVISMLFVSVLSCKTAQTPGEIILNPAPISTPTPNNYETFPKIERQDTLPLNIREAMENAEEFEILSLDEKIENSGFFEKFYVEGFPVYGNKLTKVTDGELKKQLIGSFYEDVNTGGSVAACFTPHHTIKIKYKDKKIAIAICFHCGKFVGVVSEKAFGDNIKNLKSNRFGGSFPGIEKSKSLQAFEQIIADQNVEIK